MVRNYLRNIRVKQNLVVLWPQHFLFYKKPSNDIRPGSLAYSIGETDNNFTSENGTVSDGSDYFFLHTSGL
jgi:hypothetical protein